MKIINKFHESPNGSRFPNAPGFEWIATTKSASPRAKPVRFSPELKHGSGNNQNEQTMKHAKIILNASINGD